MVPSVLCSFLDRALTTSSLRFLGRRVTRADKLPNRELPAEVSLVNPDGFGDCSGLVSLLKQLKDEEFLNCL